MHTPLSATSESRSIQNLGAFTILGGVQFFMILTMSMLSSCLTSIQISLHTPTPTLSLFTAAYGMSFAGLLLLAGAIIDLGHARKVLIIALLVFIFGSVTSALAPNTGVLLGGRVLQGAAAAFSVPAALSLIGIVYPDQKEHSRVMAIWGVLSGLGGIAGMLYGGAMGTIIGWRWTFALPILLAIIAIVLLPQLIPDTHTKSGGPINYFGAMGATVTLGAASYALITVPEYGWHSNVVLVTVSVTLVAAIVCILAEFRAKNPLFPIRLLRSVPRVLALATVFLASTSVTTVYFMLAVHYQQIFDWSDLVTAIGFLPLGVVLFFASLAMSQVISRINPVIGLPIGTCVTGVGLWLIGTGIDSSNYMALLPGLIVLPIGAAVMFTTSTTVSMIDIDESIAGRASGLINAIMEAGPSFGLVVIVSVATANTPSHTIGGVSSAIETSIGFITALHATGIVYIATAVFIALGLYLARHHP